MQENIVVLGLGYVGLPLAIALAKKFEKVVGFDVSERRVKALQNCHDWTQEVTGEEISSSSLEVTCNPDSLFDATFFIVTVPTPIDKEKRPDLGPIRNSCALIGPRLRKGSIIVFESTVYPGVTEDVCGPILEKLSGLKRGIDFFLAYSPERINPGDKVHRLQSITKVVAAENEASLRRVQAIYSSIIDAGLHIAPTIKVAEAAKVIENTQRDLNIALMNEIAMIFDRMNICTKDVLEAAGTKWNFLPFSPGLVGGHCIGVDPYYLTNAAERVGYRPEVILAGRRVNDGMGAFIARKTIKLLSRNGLNIKNARVGILGLTFKENVPDLRNSKVTDIITELSEFGIEPLVHDPLCNSDEAWDEYGLRLVSLDKFVDLDAVILAVNHAEYLTDLDSVFSMCCSKAIFIDVKSAIDITRVPPGLFYWSL